MTLLRVPGTGGGIIAPQALTAQVVKSERGLVVPDGCAELDKASVRTHAVGRGTCQLGAPIIIAVAPRAGLEQSRTRKPAQKLNTE